MGIFRLAQTAGKKRAEIGDKRGKNFAFSDGQRRGFGGFVMANADFVVACRGKTCKLFAIKDL